MGAAELERLGKICRLRRTAGSRQIVLPVAKVLQLITLAETAVAVGAAARDLAQFAMSEQETNDRAWRVRLWARLHKLAAATKSPLVVPANRLEIAAAGRRLLDRQKDRA